MTRFARAEGSKSSNARIPEEATPWRLMKQQLLENTSSDRQNTEANNAEIEKITSKFYSDKKSKSFSKESSKGSWAEFETPTFQKEKKKKHKNTEEVSDKKDHLHGIDEDGKVKKKKEKKVKKSTVEAIINTEEASDGESGLNLKKKKKNEEGVDLQDEVAQPEKKKKRKKKRVEETTENEESTSSEVKKNKIEKEVPPQYSAKTNPAANNWKNEGKTKKRRKQIQEKRTLIVDGRTIDIEYCDGFPVMKEDADRLKELRKKMLNQGIPKDEVNRAMKLERRRAEKRLSREGRKLCFHCRKSGHLMSDCPDLGQGTCTVCFKCGSTEHKSAQCHVNKGADYKFGTCFVCGEEGHIARQCPDNPRGLYPQGGSCRVCGDVTHLKKDCPQLAEEKQENAITLGTSNKSSALEALDEDVPQKIQVQPAKVNKIIKF